MTTGLTGEDGHYRLDSEFTFVTASRLFEAGAKIIKTGGMLTLDLAGTGEADSAALAVLLGWRRLSGTKGLRLVNPPPGLRALAQLYGVTELIFPN